MVKNSASPKRHFFFFLTLCHVSFFIFIIMNFYYENDCVMIIFKYLLCQKISQLQ